jgi:hypothetical protein
LSAAVFASIYSLQQSAYGTISSDSYVVKAPIAISGTNVYVVWNNHHTIGGQCNSCAKLFAPGTESGTGGTIGGGHESAKAFAPGQISTGSASEAAPGHLKP